MGAVAVERPARNHAIECRGGGTHLSAKRVICSLLRLTAQLGIHVLGTLSARADEVIVRTIFAAMALGSFGTLPIWIDVQALVAFERDSGHARVGTMSAPEFWDQRRGIIAGGGCIGVGMTAR